MLVPVPVLVMIGLRMVLGSFPVMIVLGSGLSSCISSVFPSSSSSSSSSLSCSLGIGFKCER